MLTAAVVTASAADFAFGSRSYCSLSSSVLEYTLSAAPPALRVASPNDDAVVIEDVTGQDSSDDSDTDEDDDDDDDLPVVEEVAHPKQSSAKQRAPPSRVELAQAKEEKRVEGNALFAKKRFRDAAKF